MGNVRGLTAVCLWTSVAVSARISFHFSKLFSVLSGRGKIGGKPHWQSHTDLAHKVIRGMPDL